MASSMKGFEHLEIQLEEIKLATNNFNEENVIGHGGFGKVYKGELSQTHSEGKSLVALKRLDRKHGQGDAEFHKEVRMLSCYRHENIISLLGFSRGQDEMILVYEYASRGSLDGYLKDVNLTWTQRLKICLDAAKGLSYLHDPRETYQRLIHCDIKSANILLDENFNAKVADFGLSKIGPANQQNSILVTGALGTPGYCDPVFMETYTLTKESDVYSFGIVLFEVLSGKLCFDSSNGPLKILVPMWKQSYEQKQLSGIVFQGLTEQMNSDSLETFADIAYKCLKRFREERPAMSRVVEKLQEALALQELHDLKPPKEHEEMVNAAVPPLNYRPLDELKVLLTEGLHVNEGTTEAVHQTVNVIFDDPGVQELLVKLYHKEWSEGQVTEYLAATFGDYFTDVKMYNDERSFRRVVESCLEQTIIVYVDHLLSQKNYIKEETIERMRLDEEVLLDFFTEYISVNKVENSLRILIDLRELASAESPDTFAHVYTHILEHQPDCPPDVVERIVGLREGIPRKDAKEIVQECKEIFENSLIDGNPPRAGFVFSKLKSLIDGNPPRAGFVFSKLKSLNTSKITNIWRKLH